VAVVEIEHDGIGRRLRPAIQPSNLRRSYHESIPGMISSENRCPLFRIMP
jgi:hypothetical protein